VHPVVYGNQWKWIDADSYDELVSSSGEEALYPRGGVKVWGEGEVVVVEEEEAELAEC